MQFAAKALEISMQASLTAILLSLIRHQALSTCTVPLGSFVAPVNTTKISYLWSLELWGPLTSRHLPAWRKIALFSAILVAVLLAAVVGPSSAVLMIPRPIKYHTRDFLVLLDDNATLFPTRIGPTSGSLSIEDAMREWFHRVAQDAPHVGPVRDYTGIRLFNKPLEQFNNLLQQSTGQWVASIPTNSISLALTSISGLSSGRFGAYKITADAPQPIVLNKCITVYPNSDDDPSTIYLKDENDTLRLGSLISLADFEELSMTKTYITDIPGEYRFGHYRQLWHIPPDGPRTHSLIYVESMASNSRYDSSPPPANVVVCTVDAYWVSSSLILNSTTQEIASKIGNNIDFHDLGAPISFSPDWAQKMGNASVEEMGRDFSGYIANSLAYYLALGISEAVFKPGCKFGLLRCLTRQQIASLNHFISDASLDSLFNNIYTSTSTNWTDPRHLYQLRVQTHDSGYGYDNSELPVRLSLAVLTIYCLIVVIYLAYTFITGRTASSWDSTSELVMLAMHSQKPRHLKGTSVGIDTLSTFREPVSIRVNENDSVELVFENDHRIRMRQLRDIVPNEAY